MALNSMTPKHTPWENLRGADLSAFAASDSAQKIPQTFVKYLAQHGTTADFYAYINQQSEPLEKCLQVHRYFVRASTQWLIEQLSAPNDPQKVAHTHCLVVHDIISGNCPKKLLAHIDFNKMTPKQHKDLFFRLAANGFYDTIRANRSVFEPLCKNDHTGTFLYALSAGWDVTQCINGPLETPQQRNAYFIACCKGGFLDKAITVGARTPKTIGTAFVGAIARRPSNVSLILNHLYDTYPQTPWHLYCTPSVVRNVLGISVPLAEKLIAHLLEHAPQQFKAGAKNIALSTMIERNIDGLALLMPHLHPKDRIELLIHANEFESAPCIEVIVEALPDIQPQALLNAVGTNCEPLQEVLNHMQARRLRDSTHVTKPTAKRKM